ncbi:MAG TPA: hypothetical protein VLC93_11250, partial [Myxococcota bacterium]|nr:hypothetical protein [Myxococcota bacterium]
PTVSDTVDTAYRARWNLASIHEGRGAFASAADLLEPLRRTSTGALHPDHELHLRRGQLRFKQYEQQVATTDLGSQLPALTNGRIAYEPAPLATLRTGVRAYLDLRELLVSPGVQAALGDQTVRQLDREIDTSLGYGAMATAAFAGSVQEAAVGRIMTADRDALVKRLEARGRPVPESLRGRLGITEGPLADAMAERTRALHSGVRASGLDNNDYVALWQQWSMTHRPF